MFSKETLRNLPNNYRFYVLLTSFLLSILVACWLRGQITSDQLFYIRTEQVYGFIAIVYLYVALVISPLSKLVGERGWMKNLLFARRGIGVSAAYFATLHAVVALWGQIGGLSALALLPDRFVWAFGYGAVALAVLFVMAATSFDKVVKYMTYSRWKLLHRLIYLGGILIILHVWMVGTHVAYGWAQLAAFVPISLFFGLEAWRVVSSTAKRYPEFKRLDYFVTLVLCIWLFWSGLLLTLPALVQNYHSQHHTGHEGSSQAQPVPQDGGDHE
jgi:sulfoxide reductase heme-binding subunit YedZ